MMDWQQSRFAYRFDLYLAPMLIVLASYLAEGTVAAQLTERISLDDLALSSLATSLDPSSGKRSELRRRVFLVGSIIRHVS